MTSAIAPCWSRSAWRPKSNTMSRLGSLASAKSLRPISSGMSLSSAPCRISSGAVTLPNLAGAFVAVEQQWAHRQPEVLARRHVDDRRVGCVENDRAHALLRRQRHGHTGAKRFAVHARCSRARCLPPAEASIGL